MWKYIEVVEFDNFDSLHVDIMLKMCLNEIYDSFIVFDIVRFSIEEWYNFIFLD